jgi:hypothetical protein
MVAALCRLADIDPLDDQFPHTEERERLLRLAAYLAADTVMPPTAVIDSGNGVQPIWAISREPLTALATNRVEAESRALENLLGAAGTHNIDRLLRLPGTINFPNAKKLKLGRGTTRARLLHIAAKVYRADEAEKLPAHLAAYLANTGLVRERDKPDPMGDAAIRGLIDSLRRSDAQNILKLDDLPSELILRLEEAIKKRAQLARRWLGDVDDLKEAGKDCSRSGMDMSLAAMLKGAGFTHLQAGLVLCAYVHGKTNKDVWPDSDARLRHVARCVIRSYEPPVDPFADVLAEFNKRYMVVNEAGKAVIYEPAYDPLLNRQYYIRLTFADLRRLYQNRRVCVGSDGGEPVLIKVADVWLSHPCRRQYIGGIVFDPSRQHVRADQLNLWQGFAVQPCRGSWSLMHEHIKTVICAGNLEYLNYFIGWMARLVQYPEKQGEIAIVLRGIEGTGKGIVARALLHIVGQHGFAINNSKQLTGNFNNHLRDCVLVFADEAFFPGDRAHVGTLKSLITEPFLTIEAKYQNAVQTPNFVHLIMASNEDWVVPAAIGSRRFFVLDVLPERANDHAYFAKIQAELESGGYEAMLHYLLSYNLDGYNPRRVPVTAGLQTQRKLSLPTGEHWWREILHRCYVFESRLGLESYFSCWHEVVSMALLYRSYNAHAKERGERRPMAREELGKFMREMGATHVRPRDVVIGEHIIDVSDEFGKTSRKAKLIRQRANAFDLGGLAVARANFEKTTGLEIEWPPEDD